MPDRSVLAKLLKHREYLSVASSNTQGQPNAAPKFLLKFDNPFLYLIDYTNATTVANFKVNPRASLSFMDLENLEGYRLNGSVEIIDQGEEFDGLKREFEKKALRLSADRVIESSKTGKKYTHFELEIPDSFVVIKLKLEEATRIGLKGDFLKESDPEFHKPSDE